MNSKHYICIICILAAIGCGVTGCIDSNGATNEVKNMKTREDRVTDILNLPVADYFSFDEDKQLALQEALAAQFDDDGAEPASSLPPVLRISAPNGLSLDEHSAVPLIIGRVESGLRAWQVNYTTNLHLFVKNITTGDFLVTEPLADMRRGQQYLLSGVGEPPDDLRGQTLHSSVSLIDLQKKLDGRMGPGLYKLRAVAYELSSNTVMMRLESSSAPPPEATFPGPQPYVKYMLDKSAELENKVNIPKNASANGDCFVELAIQVREDAGVQKAEAGEIYWTCNLILVKLDEQPVIISATGPVQEVSLPDKPSIFNAVFQVDLHAATKTAGGMDVGVYQVYLDAGLDILGPYSLFITD